MNLGADFMIVVIRLRTLMGKLALILITGYQSFLSPLLGKNCRFEPTCSCYAHDAIGRFGFLKGSYLSIKRIVKCHPFHPGGYDPLVVEDDIAKTKHQKLTE